MKDVSKQNSKYLIAPFEFKQSGFQALLCHFEDSESK